jgi:UDP:flavonoid glycosyltransferase YjiC (YdhE family)
VPRHVLFVCHDAGGTIPPVLAVAEAIVELGDRVTILSQPSVQARAEAVGAAFEAFAGVVDYDARRALEEQLERTLPMLCGPDVGDDLLRVTGATGADVVVVDPNLAGALAAAETSGCTTATLLHSLPRTYRDLWLGGMWSLFESAVNETRKRFGLAPASSWWSLLQAQDAVVVASPAVFDDDESLRSEVEHHGFLVPRARRREDAALVPGGEGPAVLVGLSTTYQHQEQRLVDIVRALVASGVRALVTTGGHGPADLASSLPPHVRVVERAEHASVIRSVDLVITHAGLGTTAVALGAGVPMLCLPLDRDQPLNADRVEALGAGVVLDTSAGADEIGAAVDAMLGDLARHRTAASLVAAASRDAGGAPAAARSLLAR